ncbi:MAG: porin [Cellvibrionaceae bacterium]
MKKTLLAIALATASTTLYAADAKVSFSGHVNYLFGDLEDFTGNEDTTVDGNGASGSRVRFVSSVKHGEITYGARQEFSVGSGNGSNVGVRVNQFTLNGGFGQLSLGTGWEAGDDAAEQDLSGTYLLTGSGYDAWGLGFGKIDGSRDERLRYDSPKFGGVVKFAVDYDDSEDISVAVFAGGSNWKVAGYIEQRDDDDSDEAGVSASFNLGGFVLTGQLGERDETASGADDNRSYAGVILGYNKGKYSVAVDFANYEVNDGDTTDRDTAGLSFVYRPGKGVELYAGLRSADDNVGTFVNGEDSGEALLVGARVKF